MGLLMGRRRAPGAAAVEACDGLRAVPNACARFPTAVVDMPVIMILQRPLRQGVRGYQHRPPVTVYAIDRPVRPPPPKRCCTVHAPAPGAADDACLSHLHIPETL